MALEAELGDERPSKKARLLAPLSPSPSSTSDTAYDDDDDLYDSPMKPQTPTTFTSKEDPKPDTVDHVLSTKPGEAAIPGLSLLSTEHSQSPSAQDSSLSFPSFASTDKPSQDLIADSDTVNNAKFTVATLPGLTTPHEHEDLPRRASSTAPLTLEVPVPECNEDDLTAESTADRPSQMQEFLEAAQSNKDQEGAEWQYDSSDGESSNSPNSSSSDSSGESDDEDFQMLSAEEQARILMQEGAGSDDEGGTKNGKFTGGRLRTANEKPDEVVERPNVTVTSDMEIRELGIAESIVENFVLVKGTISGESRVLESGSVLCLEDRNVIGVVAEPLGRVEEPYYSIAFTNGAAIQESGIGVGNKVFFVVDHATYVFTQPLKSLKGSDASNQHDEEVGADEMEFSDDEAEAEYKRTLKQEKLAKKGLLPATKNPSLRTFHGATNQYPDEQQRASQAMNYDEEDADDLYTPLARPANLYDTEAPNRPPLGKRSGRGSAKFRGERTRGERNRNNRSNKENKRQGAFTIGSGKQLHRPEGASRPSDSQPSNSAQWPLHTSQSLETSPYISEPIPSSTHQAYHVQYNQSHPFQSYPGQFTPLPMVWPQNAYGISQYQSNFPQSPLSSHPPMSPGGNIPAGAFVNPAFFRNQSQSPLSPMPQQQHPYSQPHYQYQYLTQQPQPQAPHHLYGLSSHGSPASPKQSEPVSPLMSGGNIGRGGSPESDAAFQLAQEKLNILRELSKRSGSP